MTDANNKKTRSIHSPPDGHQPAAKAEPVRGSIASTAGKDKVVELLLDFVDPSPYQPSSRLPRKKSDVDELMAGLAAHGQLQPIIASPSHEPGRHVVHSGHRRCAALRFLGRKTVLAVIRELTEREARRLVIGDNLGRQELSAMEKAFALKEYCEAYEDLDFETAADELGVKRSTAYRLKTLLGASQQLQEIFAHGKVGARPGEALAKIEAKDASRALRLAERFVAGEINATHLDKVVKSMHSKTRKRVAARKAVELAVNERELRLNVNLNWHQVELGGATMTELTLALARFLGHARIPRIEAAVVDQGEADELV